MKVSDNNLLGKFGVVNVITSLQRAPSFSPHFSTLQMQLMSSWYQQMYAKLLFYTMKHCQHMGKSRRMSRRICTNMHAEVNLMGLSCLEWKPVL